MTSTTFWVLTVSLACLVTSVGCNPSNDGEVTQAKAEAQAAKDELAKAKADADAARVEATDTKRDLAKAKADADAARVEAKAAKDGRARVADLENEVQLLRSELKSLKKPNGVDSAPAVEGRAIGEWCNKDFATGGITRVHIRQDGTKLIAHMWGRCHPTECDWGEATATIEENGKVLSLTWNKSFQTVTQKLTVLADGLLELTAHTHFTDKSGRADRNSKYTFAKGLAHDWNDPPKK